MATHICAKCGASFERYKISASRAARPQYCSKECLNESKKGPRLPVNERFWKMVDTRKKDGCWEFIGHRRELGYGWFNLNGKPTTAHRVAYILCNGEIPVGMFVCHSCDNPSCCNPKHLWLGTPAENTADMDSKGRRKSVYRVGENHARSKLTEKDVLEIRASADTMSKLAERYGVTAVCVSHVLNRKTWRHI